MAILPSPSWDVQVGPKRRTAGLWESLARPAGRAPDTGAAPTFAPGLRLMLLLLLVLPLFDRRFLRPFPMMAGPDREAFMVELDAHPSYIARQLVATFKILACFAWFDADSEPAPAQAAVR